MNPKSVRERCNAILHPLIDDKRLALRKRWNSLPDELRTARQISGKQFTHCGFLTGASYCSFHCTHCYLPENANRARIPSLQELREQIEANRQLLGPSGGLQITGGDVVDAYWRTGRADELVVIVSYAVKKGLVPILMTHGQTLIEQPEFLERLVVEAGLRQVSIHIDMTQAGRKNFPIQRVKSEAYLHPVREAFTQLVLDRQAKTGIQLSCALTCTVTQHNLQHVPEVIRWHLENTARTGVWRMLAFLPEADTGRTLFSAEPVTPEMVWKRICEGTGIPLRRDAVNFGHPDCNSWAPLLVSRSSHRVPRSGFVFW